MVAKIPSTLSLKDQAIVWHPFTQMQTARPPIPIVKAKGVYLHSEDGRSYLDGISSWWVNLHGHGHPHMVNAIKNQLDKLEQVIFADFTHAPAIHLADKLLTILPKKMSRIFYSDNGSTSVETALKMALQYWFNHNDLRKTKVISFKNGYHGDTMGAMAAAGPNEFNRPFRKHLFKIESIDPPLKGFEERSLSQLESIVQTGEAACFIFEPLILGAGGMIIYPPQGLNALIECCRQYQVLTIADEVMTGFGRTGPLFACDYLNEKPDLICLSKGLTGGFLPLGATACTEEIYRAFLGNSFQQAFLHGHSYTANPLACSSALASLELLNEDCSMQRKMIENSHHNFCQRLKMHPKLKRCESIGTILVLEYAVDDSSYFHSIRNYLFTFFLENGILLRPIGNVLYVMPPYCISEEELNQIYEKIKLTLYQAGI